MPPLKGEVARVGETEGLGSLEKEYRKGIPYGHWQRLSADRGWIWQLQFCKQPFSGLGSPHLSF
jgi:hypothetical protein